MRVFDWGGHQLCPRLLTVDLADEMDLPDIRKLSLRKLGCINHSEWSAAYPRVLFKLENGCDAYEEWTVVLIHWIKPNGCGPKTPERFWPNRTGFDSQRKHELMKCMQDFQCKARLFG